MTLFTSVAGGSFVVLLESFALRVTALMDVRTTGMRTGVYAGDGFGLMQMLGWLHCCAWLFVMHYS